VANMDVHSMLGEFSNADRVRSVPRVSVLGPSASRRGIVASLQRRLRGRDEIPAWGQIVIRSASQILR
jgi:hypothetical protein